MKRFFLLAVAMVFTTALLAQKNDKDKDWALYSRYAPANDTVTVAPKAVFMGNSITENWLKFHPEFFQKNNYAARGISGQTTYHMLARFHNDVVALNPKVVVILSGINDIARNSGYISLENIMGNIISMCDIARANGIVPVLCSILPADYFVWRKDLKPAQDVIELNAMIRKYAAEQGFEYVDYHSFMSDEKGALKEGLSKDHCHPYPDAYYPMEEAVVKAINKAAKQKLPRKRNRK